MRLRMRYRYIDFGIDIRQTCAAQCKKRASHKNAQRIFAARRAAHIYRQNLSAQVDCRAHYALGANGIYKGYVRN